MFSMMNITYKTKEYMKFVLRILKGEIKLKFILHFRNSFDEMNYLRQSGIFHFEEDTFIKNA